VCTASWLRSPRDRTSSEPASPGPSGSPSRIDFFFNRDELLTREPALPPREGSSRGVRFLAPVDGRAGGTWLLVTERGLILALLNRNDGRSDGRRDPGAAASRGELPPALAAAADPAELLSRLDGRGLARYPPFTLAALWRDPAAALVASWDGDHLASAPLPGEVGLLCSSGLGDEAARRGREATWLRMRAAVPEPSWSAESHRAFHRSHDPEPHAFSVCMHRDDAATVSTAEVTATRAFVELTYRPGSACAPGEATRLRLATVRPAVR
jgi:hypothetical protein